MNDPYKVDPPFVVAMSGGETSGYLLRMVLNAWGGTLPADSWVVFDNTGKEREKALEFVERCSLEWSVYIHWLEYVWRGSKRPPHRRKRWTEREYQNHLRAWKKSDAGKRWKAGVQPSHTYREVNYATASRNGEPFEAVTRHRGFVPNIKNRFCTGELKVRTKERFMADQGYSDRDSYVTLIGLRADEPDRIAALKADPQAGSLAFPLHAAGVTKPMVNDWWATMPFRLGLKGYQGNCDLCWHKDIRHIVRTMHEEPERAAWWIEQERWAQKNARSASGRRFRRERVTYAGLLELAQRPRLFDDSEWDEDKGAGVSCVCTD
jgi:hypothetical protein